MHELVIDVTMMIKWLQQLKSSRKVVSYVCTHTVSAKTPQVESKLYGSIM